MVCWNATWRRCLVKRIYCHGGLRCHYSRPSWRQWFIQYKFKRWKCLFAESFSFPSYFSCMKFERKNYSVSVFQSRKLSSKRTYMYLILKLVISSKCLRLRWWSPKNPGPLSQNFLYSGQIHLNGKWKSPAPISTTKENWIIFMVTEMNIWPFHFSIWLNSPGVKIRNRMTPSN